MVYAAAPPIAPSPMMMTSWPLLAACLGSAMFELTRLLLPLHIDGQRAGSTKGGAGWVADSGGPQTGPIPISPYSRQFGSGRGALALNLDRRGGGRFREAADPAAD